MAIHEVFALRSPTESAQSSFPFFQRLYFVQELLFFVGLALLVMCSRQHSMGQHITDIWAENLTESRNSSFATASFIATGTDSGSA
jgi:hypothetical protein